MQICVNPRLRRQENVFIRVHSWFYPSSPIRLRRDKFAKQSQFQMERRFQTHALKRLPRPSGPPKKIDGLFDVGIEIAAVAALLRNDKSGTLFFCLLPEYLVRGSQ